MGYVKYMPDWYKSARYWVFQDFSKDPTSKSASVRRRIAERLIIWAMWMTPPVERMAFMEFLEAYREARVAGFEATHRIMKNRLQRFKKHIKEQEAKG